MGKEQIWAAALAAQRRMYLRLSEVLELTEETLEALGRRDQVSVRMFLQMRQEPIQQLQRERELLRRQCGTGGAEAAALRSVLNGGPAGQPADQALCQQVERNRLLLEKVLRADQALSRRMGGEKSFYAGGGARRGGGRQDG